MMLSPAMLAESLNRGRKRRELKQFYVTDASGHEHLPPGSPEGGQFTGKAEHGQSPNQMAEKIGRRKKPSAKKPEAVSQQSEDEGSGDNTRNLGKSLSQEHVMDLLDSMMSWTEHKQFGLVPIYKVREAISGLYGDQAASHEVLDGLLKQMRRERKLRLVALGDPEGTTSEQHNASIPGEGETFFYISDLAGQPHHENKTSFSHEQTNHRRYEEGGGHWVTIGSQEGEDGKKTGGTPVFIKGDKITKGPAGTVGKSPSDLANHFKRKPDEQKSNRAKTQLAPTNTPGQAAKTQLAPEPKAPEKPAHEPPAKAPDAPRSVMRAVAKSLKSPDELAKSLKKPESSQQPAAPSQPAAPAAQKVSSGEAMKLFNSIDTDPQTGYPMIVMKEVAAIMARNPSASKDDLLQEGTMAMWKAASNVQVGREKEFPGLAQSAVKNHFASLYRSQKAVKRGMDKTKSMGEEFDAADREPARDLSEASEELKDAIGKLSPDHQTIINGMMGGRNYVQIGQELGGWSKASVSREWDKIRKILGSQIESYAKPRDDHDQYIRHAPIAAEVWHEILAQSYQYGPRAADFVRAVMTAMDHTDSQWEAIMQGRRAFLSGRYEKEKRTHEFSSTQFNLDGVVAKKIRAMSDSIPDSVLTEEGREDEPHITVKFGLNIDNADEVAKVVRNFGPVKVRLTTTKIFPARPESRPGKESQDVVYVAVESEDLHRLNKLIADSIECTDTHPSYIPHVCLAYVKPGMGQKYVGMMAADGDEMTFTELVFSDKSRDHITIPLESKRRHEYGPRHSPPKRIEGAIARLEALRDFSHDIDESELESEVDTIAREFSADDLKDVARGFGVEGGIANKAECVAKILKRVCKE